MIILKTCLLLVALVIMSAEAGWPQRHRKNSANRLTKNEDNFTPIIGRNKTIHHKNLSKAKVVQEPVKTESNARQIHLKKGRRRSKVAKKKRKLFQTVPVPCVTNSSCLCFYNAGIVTVNCYNLTTVQSFIEAIDAKQNTNSTMTHVYAKDSSFEKLPDDFLAGRKIRQVLFKNVQVGQISTKAFRGIQDLYNIVINGCNMTRLPDIYHHASPLLVARLQKTDITELGIQLANITTLKVLSLDKNKLSHIDENAFENLSSLTFLDLSGNQLTQLSPRIFRHLGHIRDLRLHHNLLRTLPGVLTSVSTTIERLAISYNRLESLENVLPMRAAILTHLDVSNNNLKSLRVQDFKSKFPQLRSLFVHNNSLEMIEPQVFQSSLKLKQIDLSYNALSELSPGVFAHLENLVRVKVTSNKFVDPSQSFSQAKNLKELTLDKNNINHINNTFGDIPQVLQLSLNENNLTRIVNLSFIHNRRLKYLYLMKNKISYLEPDAFWGLHALIKLHLAKNQISELNGALAKLPTLKTLYLGQNLLTKLTEDDFKGRLVIKTLSLDSNRLTDISGAFRQLKVLYHLTIANNLIKVVPENSFSEETHLRFFIFIGNPLNCDCRMAWIWKLLHRKKLKTHKLTTCFSPARFHKQHIRFIKTKSLYEWPQDCPERCNCFCQPNGTDFSVHVDCSGKGLTQVPLSFPNKTIMVNVSSNGISTLPKNLSSLLPSLQELDVEYNNISTLDGVDFPSSLTKFRLAYNRMSVLNRPMGTANQSLTFTTMSHNPWRCDCSALAFRTWLLNNHKAVQDVNYTRCASDDPQSSKLGNRVLTQLHENDLCPIPIAVYIIVIIVVLGCLLMGTSFFITYIQYRMPIKVWLYSRGLSCIKEEDLDEDKLFDAFLAFSNNDEDIANIIVNRLEKRPQPDYRLCLHYRDFIAGNYILDNINWAIKSSKKIIILLSRNFLESSWTLEEFKIAHQQTIEEKLNRIILVIVGDLPPKDELTKDIQSYLMTATYLRWEDNYFWEKIMYAMPKVALGSTERDEEGGDEDTHQLLTHYV